VPLEEPGDDCPDALLIAFLEIGADLERGSVTAVARAAAAKPIEEATGWHGATIVHPPCAMH
jgi:hypothetical protein